MSGVHDKGSLPWITGYTGKCFDWIATNAPECTIYDGFNGF
jgi:hypothetical protein